jgi:hypothetical protein
MEAPSILKHKLEASILVFVSNANIKESSI